MNQLEMSVCSSVDYFDAFRKLYYYLYSNSNASRAERIIGDLSKLLLVALCRDRSPAYQQQIEWFLTDNVSANTSLLPILKSQYANVFGSDDKFHLDDNSLRYGFLSIANLDLHGAKSHLLGDAFQALIGPNLRGDKGQFFTPRSIVRCMISVLSPKAGTKVVDPACGTAGFLTETASFWEAKRREPGRLVGIDKDTDLFVFASALCELAAPETSRILNANSLDLRMLSAIDAAHSPLGADYVLTNPPFGAKIPIKEPEILAQYDLGFNWEYSKHKHSWLKTGQLRSSQDPQTLFIELCVKLLKPEGTLGIVLPEGVFGNTGSGYIWDYLRSHGEVFGLIDCPRTSFQPGTDTKTNILFFKKTERPRNDNMKIAVALACGHDRRGRTSKNDGTPFPDDFASIANDWAADAHNYWFESHVSNKYYLVPRYYDRKTDLLLERDAARFNAKIVSFEEMINRGWISIRKGHEVGSEAYGTGDIPFVRTSDISNFEVSIDPTKSVSEETFNSVKHDQGLKPGAILMVVDGRYRIGRCAILHEFNYKCIAQSHLRIITVEKTAPFNPFELLYLLSLASVQRDIRSLVFIQSTLGSLGSRVREIKIPVPDAQNAEFSTLVESFTEALTARAKLLNVLTSFDEATVEL
ncbi:MAG: N-6 DNA methylase [Gammaproteobacteria bacterium]|nr:N-6 DNA methylase [Gammaproteobacteria bacterium]MBU2005592.1 N-6 DNA methylase [Gammaproteobacteria bacterium]